jgi:hypothetical protein
MQPGPPGQPTGTDDTGAFQRFYSGGSQANSGVLQRFVAWWRERVKGVTAR